MRSPVGAVRGARASDLPRLVQLWIEVAAHHAALDPLFTLRADAATSVQRLLAAQLAAAESAVFVWEEGREIRGFCTVQIDVAPPILTETRRAQICDLGVETAARRRGVGRALANAAIEWVRSRGVARVEVRVAVRNREGQHFWRSQGFADLVDVLERRL